MLQTNTRLELAEQFIKYTNKHIFLTGKAGTGKTTFLKNIKYSTPKRMVVVAPTGVAAINAGGVTIHSFFQLPFGPHLPNAGQRMERKFNNDKIKAIKAIDLLVIDEISMVRADVLDGIDEVLRRYRIRNKPFGGVQLLMIGDLHQLAPVVKDDEWNLLRPYYSSIYFFESMALKQTELLTIELTHIFRQQDDTFINLLNKVRDKKLDSESVSQLNSRYQPDFVPPKGEEYITLCTHNHAAQTINQKKINELKGKSFTFKADVTDDFPEHMYPNEQVLELKIGAQIMFVKNDINREKLYYNGKLGVITSINDQIINVRCKGDYEDIPVTKVAWENIKYALDDNKVMQETVIGTFAQLPIKTAWAITIHKSQGLTFERAIIDAQASFAHGQVYVALSRCKSFEGLVLSSPISIESVKSDNVISTFDQEAEQQDLSENTLFNAKKATQAELIRELFDFSGIKKNIYYLYKAIEPEQKYLAAGTFTLISEISKNFELEIGAVASKFLPQLEVYFNQPELPESNTTLQERVKKGTEYLHQKMKDFVYQPITTLDLECDNKETKKVLFKASDNCLKTIFEKMQGLKSAQASFDSTKYLQAVANASIDFEIEKVGKKASKSGNAINLKSSGKGGGNDLYDLLKYWRDEQASTLGIERYMVLQQKTIKSLVDELPGNMAALAKINGIGKAKMDQFGTELLELITEYCIENELEPNLGKKSIKVEKPVARYGTADISFELFQSGKSVGEISLERQLAISTIEGHLCEMIERGKLDVENLMDLQKIIKIKDTIAENPTFKGKELKETLGEDYSYNEIKMVYLSLKQVQ
jgi:PIF1-like helicase/Helix-turn-helix domain/HRDC domain